jgi:hypothetical protein
MPVIGRLDEQVDELIISPVSKRRRGEEPARDRREDAQESPPPAPTETPATGESSAERAELPVWLL